MLLAFGLLAPNLVASETTWKVDKVSLAPGSNLTGRLTVGLSRGSTAFEITAEVRLTAVADYFVFRDRLVVLGDLGRASGVVIFDLANRKALDSFGCWEARRISDSWIASVEWYPEHGQRWPTDVVLIYDLDKTPAQNRLRSATSESIAVGIPVYPSANAVQESYRNVAPSAELASRIIGAPYFILLPSRWLVFVAAQEGGDYSTMEDHLVVVDLSHGLIRPPAREVEIPTGAFTKTGKNPKMIHIDAMEAVGEQSVRLLLPKSEYGISSEVVNLAIGRSPDGRPATRTTFLPYSAKKNRSFMW